MINMVNLTIEELIIIIIGILAWQYFIFYFREKGKNLATKEDIAEITHEIEEVKTQYSSDLEKFKAELQLMVRNDSLISENVHETLLIFFKDCTSLYYEKLTISFYHFPVDEGETLMDYHISTIQLFTKILSDYHMLALYFEKDSEVLIAAANVVKDVKDIRSIFKEKFINYKIAHNNENKAFLSCSSKEEIRKLATESDLKLQEYYNELEPTAERMMSHFNEYLNALKKHFKVKGLDPLIEPIQ